jgi:hypothetical protein
MTAPHVESDDTAILAAHDKRLANAGMSLDAAVCAFKAKARREFLDRLVNAAIGYHDEYVAGLERLNGKPPGSFERISEETVRAAAGPAWDGEFRPQNDFGRGA